MSVVSELPVYILTHEFYPKRGGVATYVEEMARALVALGRTVEVWAPANHGSNEKSFPFKVRRMPLNGSEDLSCQIALCREWYRNRNRLSQSVVLLADPGPMRAMRFLQFFNWARPKSLMLAFHGSEIFRFAANPLSKSLVRKVIKKADRISVLSHYTRDLLERSFPESSGKVRITPGAVRNDFKPPSSPSPKSDDQIKILCVGRLHPRKGQAELIEALANLPDVLKRRAQLWIVGTGNKHGYGDHLKNAAKQADVNVSFLGDVTDDSLQELYLKADLFAMTSVPFRSSVEGFGIVYLEAAAYGLPIVANDIGGVSDAVANGENGILVEPGDKSELTQAIKTLIEDSSLRRSMSQNGILWSQRHSWMTSASALIE